MISILVYSLQRSNEKIAANPNPNRHKGTYKFMKQAKVSGRNKDMSKKEFSKQTKKGFTLVEVMVVIVVISIIALFAGPILSAYGPNARLKGASRDLHSNLQRVKVTAIKRNKNVFITLTPVTCPAHPSSTVPSPGGTYSITVDEDNSGTINAGDTSLLMPDNKQPTDNIYDIPGNTALCANASLPLGGTTFRFTPRGLWLDNGGNALVGNTVFQTQNDKKTGYKSTVSLAGGIKTEKL